MDDNSSKCTECGSFQNWRRHINITASILPLLIALTSVIGWGVSNYRAEQRRIETEELAAEALRIASLPSNIQIEVPKNGLYLVRYSGNGNEDPYYDLYIELLITNIGKKAGYVESVSVRSSWKIDETDETDENTFDVVFRGDIGKVVHPNDYIVSTVRLKAYDNNGFSKLSRTTKRSLGKLWFRKIPRIVRFEEMELKIPFSMLISYTSKISKTEVTVRNQGAERKDIPIEISGISRELRSISEVATSAR